MPAGGGQTIIQAMYAAGANAKTPEQRQLYQDLSLIHI